MRMTTFTPRLSVIKYAGTRTLLNVRKAASTKPNNKSGIFSQYVLNTSVHRQVAYPLTASVIEILILPRMYCIPSLAPFAAINGAM